MTTYIELNPLATQKLNAWVGIAMKGYSYISGVNQVVFSQGVTNDSSVGCLTLREDVALERIARGQLQRWRIIHLPSNQWRCFYEQRMRMRFGLHRSEWKYPVKIVWLVIGAKPWNRPTRKKCISQEKFWLYIALSITSRFHNVPELSQLKMVAQSLEIILKLIQDQSLSMCGWIISRFSSLDETLKPKNSKILNESLVTVLGGGKLCHQPGRRRRGR